MAIRYSSSGGTPFGDTSGRPSSPAVGQTYYNGQLGYLEIYTISGWIPATGANDFSLNITGTNTTVTFNQTYSSGSYSIVSFLNDATLDIYAYASDGSLAGYSNTKAFTATQRFNKMVILGGSYGDVLQFSYKTTYATSASTTDVTAGPYITSVTPSGMPNLNDTITITGGNFATNVTVAFTGTGYSSTPAKSIVRSSATSLIVTRPDNFPPSGAPYTVTVTNPSISNQPTGSSVHQYSGITAGNMPIWVTDNSISDIYMDVAYSKTLSATDSDGGSNVTYSYVSGSLPTGLSFSNGIISGTATTGGQSTTYTVRATDSGGNTTDRTFTITVSFPTLSGGTLTSDSTYYYRTFTGNGSMVLNGQISVDVLTIAGGGAGGTEIGGGGGAGGVLYSPSQNLSSQTYSITVGGGAPGPSSNGIDGGKGTNSSLTGSSISIVATGGGGGERNGGTGNPNRDGGSGGGTSDSIYYGTGIVGQGNDGGISNNSPNAYGSGGGGGAGAKGANGTSNNGGNGGSGTNAYSSWLTAISSAMTGVSGWSTATSTGYIGGGGGGAVYDQTSSIPGSGGAGGGGNGGRYQNSTIAGTAGITNTGGGGGGQSSVLSTGSGGSGLVIIRYLKTAIGG